MIFPEGQKEPEILPIGYEAPLSGGSSGQQAARDGSVLSNSALQDRAVA